MKHVHTSTASKSQISNEKQVRGRDCLSIQPDRGKMYRCIYCLLRHRPAMRTFTRLFTNPDNCEFSNTKRIRRSE